jgi:hypothetical protein
MALPSQAVGQHKRMAMGQGKVGFKAGGTVAPGRGAGMPMNPITKAKMGNGIPGFKKGGSAKGKC